MVALAHGDQIFSRSAILVRLLTLLILCLAMLGCDKRRPPGYIHLGLVKDHTADEEFLADKHLVLRHDANGYSVMSTECTYDLSPLVRVKNSAGEFEFASTYSKSRYKDTGEVLSGPADKPLPYYRLVLDSAVYGGPKDALYVRISDDVAPSWRLSVEALGKS